MEALRLNRLRYFILDECDKVLEALDMRRDVQEIFLKTPKNKQVFIWGGYRVWVVVILVGFCSRKENIYPPSPP